MAGLDPSIILQGRPANVLGAMAQGMQLRAAETEMRRQNALADLYQRSGAGLLSGDATAYNALAAMDPTMALNLQSALLGQDATRADMRIADERLGMDRETHALQVAAADRGPAPDLHAVDGYGVVDYTRLAQGGDPNAAVMLPERAGANGATFRVATPQEAAQYGAQAGQIDTKTGRFYPNNPPRNTTTRVRPDGTVEIIDGSGQGRDQSDVSDPSSIAAMIGNIDGILSDPALDLATGMLSWTQMIPGTGMKRFGTRADQLNGQAFLQAIDALRGSGAISEIEGAKAQQAVARLDTQQSPQDYRAALTELRGILASALGQETGQAPAPATVSSGNGYTPVQAGVPSPVQASSGSQGSAAPQDPAGNAQNPYAGMDVPQMLDMNLSSMTAQEVRAWNQRMAELGF